MSGPSQVFATAIQETSAFYSLRLVAPGGDLLVTSSGLALATEPLSATSLPVVCG